MINDENIKEEKKVEHCDDLFKNPESNLKLNANWVFWYASRKEKDHHIPYSERLINIAEFSTLEDFFRYYLFIKSVPDIERNTDLGLFKQGYQPLWESCPDGGCWFVRFKKTDDPMDIDIKWEKLLFALVGKDITNIRGTF
jgi:translation initiation factor 4E